jgi:VanZ family protein
VIDELLQIPVNRTADIYDVCADMVGCVIGLAAFVLTRRLMPGWWDVVTGDD